MRCKKYFNALISMGVCIKRQEIVENILKCGKKESSLTFNMFSKCIEIGLGKKGKKIITPGCAFGKKIRKKPHPKHDKDYRKLLRQYLPKIKKVKLKTKIVKIELKKKIKKVKLKLINTKTTKKKITPIRYIHLNNASFG